MQVFQGTGNQAKERVSVGDVNGDGSVYGLRVRGADGQTILLDENGVKSEGITDGAITNDKISDNANIDGAKLNINSVVSKINEDGTETIQGTKIEVDGTTLNTKLSTITTKQTEDSERITQAQSQITANTNAIKLKVDEQTYTTDKKDMTSKLEKNTSEISAMKGEIALKVEQTDIENAINEATLSRADFIARNFLSTPLIVSDSTLPIYTSSGIPNPPIGSVFGGFSQERNIIKDNNISSNGSAWAIIVGYEFYKNTTDNDKKNKIRDVIKKVADFMANNVSIGRFNSMDFNFIDTNYKYDSTSKSWVKSNYKEIYISTLWLQVKAMVYAYEILKDNTYSSLCFNILDSLFNTHFYINAKVASNELPTHLEWSSYEYLACDNLSTNYRFVASTKQYANQMGYYIHQAIPDVIRVFGDNERPTPKGDIYKPSDILVGLKKYLKNAYDTQNITAKPLGLPYGYFHRVENESGGYDYIPQNWNFIEDTWGDGWFVGDVVTYTIYAFAASGLTDIAREYADNYYKLRVNVKDDKWSTRFNASELIFYDRMDFYTGSHLSDDDSISITYTALYYEILKQIGKNEHIDACCYTLAKHQINNLDNKNIDGGYPWDISRDDSSLEFKSFGEIINSQFYKNLNITSFTAIDNKFAEIKVTTDTISQNVSNLSQTVSNKADGSTVSTLNNKVGSLETSVNGITGKVSNLEQTTNTINGKVSSIDTRLTSAESKITETAITNTVKKNFYTKDDINNKGYQTSSQVQQTVDGLQVKVQQSGGYNLLRNGCAKNGTAYWSNNGGGISVQDTNAPTNEHKYFNSSFPNGIVGEWVQLKNNTYYTYSAKINLASAINMTDTTPLHFWCNTTQTSGNPQLSIISRSHTSIPANQWVDIWVTFKTATSNTVWFRPFLYTGGSSVAFKVTELMLCEGSLDVPYAPHPSEIYDGATTIDKDGVTVTASNVKSKTNMSADGFKITKTDTNEDVFKVNADGTLYMKGQIIVTGGSVPTSNLSGTISSNQLNSSITSDINNAKNNASSALSTANTANSTANSNKTNITNLQGEVNTVKSNVASLEVTTSGISQKVSSVESTTATLSGKVDTANNNATSALNTANSTNTKLNNLQIGGRNLIRNSQNYSNWLGENGTTVSTIDNSNEPTKILQVTTNGSASGHVKINVSNYIKGKEYILSFYAKNISGDKTINFEPHGGPVYSVTSTSEWVQYKVKIIPNLNWSSTSPYFYFNNKNNTSVFQIKNVKLEEGNKATDWTPAPEDVDGAINSVDSKVDTLRTEYNSTKSKVATIETNLSGITSRVSSTETNIEKISNASSQNLLYNSDFRIINGSLPDGWSTDSSKITLDPNTTLLDGIPTFWFNVTGLTENAWKAVYSPFISAKAGEKFVASAYVLGHNNWSVLDAGGGLEIEYYNDNERISTSGVSIDKSNLNWKRLVVKGIAPTGTTRVRIRVHPVRNGQFNMSKPMLQYGETVTGWDRGFDINNLTTRLKTAESKITEDAITNTVKKSFYTKSETDSQITSKGYQTASQVQQTVNGLQIKVQESGGYNLIYNGNFKKDLNNWNIAGDTSKVLISSTLSCSANQKGVRIEGTLKNAVWVHQSVPWDSNEPITLSYWQHTTANGSDGTTNPFRATQVVLSYTDGTSSWHTNSGQSKYNTWEKFSYTITPDSGKRVRSVQVDLWCRDTTKIVYYTNVMLEKGSLATEYTPNPNEIYAGITTIDKDGITVTNTSSSTYTQIDSESFRVEDNKGGTVAEFSQNSQIPNLTAGIINANEIYSPNICTKSPMSGSIKYIVNGSTGNDNNNGTTYSTPFKTVAKAVSMLNTQQDRSVDIEVYGNVTGFDVKGINGTGAIRFYFSDDAIVNGAVIIGGITNTIGFHGGSSDKATFKNGISIYRCRDIEIGSLTFRGTNSNGNNIYLEDVTFARIMSCDLGGLSTQLLCAVQARRSNLWIYNCRGSKITDVVAQSEFSIAYAPRAGTSNVPDYSNAFLCNYDGAGRIHNWSGGNFVKTPSKGWNPAYTPTQKTQTWNFNKVWSDETLNGWSDRQELIQGYASTWNTGRWTGYMQFTDGMAAIRSAISGGTNFSGRLYVQRRTSSGNSTGSKLCLYASDGTLITNSTTINRGQGVWVNLSSAIISKIASGAITYFYLKADANNTSTFFKCEANPKIEITYTK